MSRKWRGGPGPAARRPASRASWRDASAAHAGHSRATLFEDAERLVDLALADDQRRQDAQHIVAGGQAQQALAAQLGDEIAGRHDRSGCRAACPEPRNSANSFGMMPRPASSSLPRSSSALSVRPARRSPAPASRRAPRCRPRPPSGCRQRSSRACPATMPTAAFSVARQAPIGKPLPSAFATAMMSGGDPGPFDARTACRCGPCRTAPRHRRAAGRTRRRSSRSPLR